MKLLLLIACHPILLLAVDGRWIVVSSRTAPENAPFLRFEITRTPAGSAQSVEYFTVGHTAYAGAHYRHTQGQLTFAPEQTVATVDVPLIDNAVVDGDKVLELRLANPVPCADIPGFVCSGNNPYFGALGYNGSCFVEGGTIIDNEYPQTRFVPVFFPEHTFRALGLELADGRFLWDGYIPSGIPLFHTPTMFLPDGRVDTNFVMGGGAEGLYHSFRGLKGGNIIALRFLQNGIAGLVKLFPNGALDPAFSPQTAVFLAELPSGQLLLSRASAGTNGTETTIYRTDSNGIPDLSFQAPAIRPVMASTFLQPDGKLLLLTFEDAGNGTSRGSLSRLNTDGSPDTGFSPPADISEAFLRSNGKIIVRLGGHWWARFGSRIAQLNPDGSFDADVHFSTFLHETRFSVASFLELPDGSLLYPLEVMRSEQGDGPPPPIGPFTIKYDTIGRILPDGSQDWNFVGPRFHNPCYRPLKLTRTSGGQILVSGTFDRVDGLPAPGVAMLMESQSATRFRFFSNWTATSNSIEPHSSVARVTVVRTGPSSQAASVDYYVSDDVGYYPYFASGRLDFAPFETSKEITFRVWDGDEPRFYYVNFSGGSENWITETHAVLVCRPLRLEASSQAASTMRVHGTVAGTPYRIERSADLQNWIRTDEPLFFGADGTVEVKAPAVFGVATFFRVRSVDTFLH